MKKRVEERLVKASFFLEKNNYLNYNLISDSYE